MNSTYRTILVAAACMAACSSPEDLCQSDADCGQGSFCDTTLAVKACVKKDIQLCDRSCGDGFLCVVEDGADRCKVESGREGTAAIREPASGVAVNGGVVRIVCEAKGPQFRAVKATATPPGGGTPIELGEPARIGSTDEFETTWNVEAAAEGAYALGCALEYGPEGETVTTQAAPVELVVDKAAPTVAHTAPAGWLKHATTQLRATVKDEGTRPSGIANVRIEFATEPVVIVPGVAAADDEYTFDANVASLGVEEGPVSYEVIATDRAGNETKASGTLQVDGKGAVAVPVVDSVWYRRDGLIRFFTEATATGAPVATVTVRKGELSWSGTRNGSEWTFDLSSTELLEAGVEAEVGVTVVVVDEAGNETSTPATVRIDDKGPTIELPASTEWVTGATKDVVVTVRDGGTGMSATGVTWVVGSQNGACVKEAAAADQYRCAVPLAVATGSVDAAYAYQVRATDRLSNASTANGTLKVDKKGPTVVNPPVDGKWYRRGETVTVRMKIADEHSGVAGAVAPLFTTTNPVSSTPGSIEADGSVTIQVLTSNIAPAGATTGAIAIAIKIFDRLGNESTFTTNSLVRVDDEKPTVSTPTVSYPQGRTNALRRDPAGSGRDRVTVTVAATDPNNGSGVTSTSIKLAYPKKGGGTERIAPTNSTSPWTFALDVATAEFNNGVGNLQAQFETSDVAGNQANAVYVSIAVTRELWAYDTVSGAKVNGAVALAGGKVFATVASNQFSSADNIHSMNAATGGKAWSAKITGMPSTPVSIGAQHAYFAYVGAGSKTWVAKYPLAPSGTPADAWACALPSTGFGTIGGALAIANWDVDGGGTPREAVAAVNGGGKLWALYGTCQNVNLSISAASSLNGGAVTVAGDRYWLGGDAGLVVTGRLLAGGFDEPKTFDAGDGTVPGVALRTNGNALLAATGALEELSVVPASVNRVSITQLTKAPLGPPAIAANGNVFFGSDDGFLFRAPTGTGYPAAMPGLPREKVKGSPVVDAEERAYVVTEDGALRAFDPSGAALWAFDTGGAGVTSQSPALSCNGTLYVGTSDGRVLAIVADAPIANSPWPKFQHDNKNTGNAGTPIYVNGVCQD